VVFGNQWLCGDEMAAMFQAFAAGEQAQVRADRETLDLLKE
jgi:hypothetical protein